MSWMDTYRQRVVTAEQAVSHIQSGQRVFLTGNCSVPQIVVSALVEAAFIVKPRLMYNHPVGQSSLLLWLIERGGPDLTRIVPTFFIEEEIGRNLALAGVWAVVAVAIALLAWRSAETDKTLPQF